MQAEATPLQEPTETPLKTGPVRTVGVAWQGGTGNTFDLYCFSFRITSVGSQGRLDRSSIDPFAAQLIT